MSPPLIPGIKNRLAELGVSRECLASSGPGLLPHRAWEFPGCLAPEPHCLALQALNADQQLVNGSLGWGPRWALGRDSQVFQGQGLPHEPGGPAPQATPGSGV